MNLSLTFVVASAATAADEIGPGSKAPPLQIKRWLKGNPVAKIEPQKTYVVEFWATWCGPCIESIPHVSALAKKNQDVTFIGVGIWEDEEGDKLPKFVKSMGDKMDYNVAYSGNKTGMSASWMEAAGQNGIPTAFIIKDQKIMWIGDPMQLDKPLAEVKAGTFDLNTFKEGYEKRVAANRVKMAKDKEFSNIIKLHDGGKRDEAKKALSAFAQKHPESAAAVEQTQYDWLADEDPAAWKAKTAAMVATGKQEEVEKITRFALIRVQKPTGAKHARAAIAMALKAKTKDYYTLLMYARLVYLKLGDDKEALEVITKMIELFPTSSVKDVPQAKETLLKDKAELEAKLAKKGGTT